MVGGKDQAGKHPGEANRAKEILDTIERKEGVEEEVAREVYRKIKAHPCYSEQASHKFGRMHLSVAPRCNIYCNYCLRKCDCVNESRPGVTSRVLTPLEAIDMVDRVMAKHSNIRVIGIAGPGEPLYNEATFETLRLVKGRFPHLQTCLSSNGLLLPEKLDLLCELGVSTLTVTLNAVDPKLAMKIYSWVHYQGKYLRGLEAAERLLSQQLAGIKGAVDAGIVVKVNTVMIPSINEDRLVEVAQKCQEMGVYTMNIMPLIPQAKFVELRAPTPEERKKAQDACSPSIRQMGHCRQCRADAVGLLGQELPLCSP